jgi:hypothetical protein
MPNAPIGTPIFLRRAPSSDWRMRRLFFAMSLLLTDRAGPGGISHPTAATARWRCCGRCLHRLHQFGQPMAVACTAFINLRELTDQGISMERTSPTRLRMSWALACWRFAAAIPMATTSTGCVSTGAQKHSPASLSLAVSGLLGPEEDELFRTSHGRERRIWEKETGGAVAACDRARLRAMRRRVRRPVGTAAAQPMRHSPIFSRSRNRAPPLLPYSRHKGFFL